MKIDLCVFLAGQNLDAYAPLFLETLFRNCNTSKLCIHVVERGYFEHVEDYSNIILDMKYYVRGVGENVHNYLIRKKEESSIPFTIYEMHDPQLFFNKTSPHEPSYHLSYDHAEMLNWAMGNCGTNKWMILCHSDILFKGDIITKLIEGMQDDVGIWGSYNHCFAVNREAFFKVGVKFDAVANFRAVETKHKGFDYEIKYVSDPDCPKDAKIIYGWDVGELLRLMMMAHGWRCDFRFNQELGLYVEHMCSGHGYVGEAARESQEMRRQQWLSKYGIQKA